MQERKTFQSAPDLMHAAQDRSLLIDMLNCASATINLADTYRYY